MAFTSLLPPQVGKEWSQVPATTVRFFPDLIIIEFEFNALDERIQPHRLFIWSECCGEEIEPRIYLEVSRKRRRHWEVIANSNVMLLGTPAPSPSAYLEFVDGRLTECVGPQPPGCGPPLPFDTRLSFVEFEGQVDFWIANADFIFGLKTEFQLFDPDFLGCDAPDQCAGREPGWYIRFALDASSDVGALLINLGVPLEELLEQIQFVSPPVVDSIGCWITEPIAWIFNKAGNQIVEWLVEKGLSSIVKANPTNLVAAVTLIVLQVAQTIDFELFLCGEPECDDGDFGIVDNEEDPCPTGCVPINYRRRNYPPPANWFGPQWDNYTICYTYTTNQWQANIVEYSPPVPCPDPTCNNTVKYVDGRTRIGGGTNTYRLDIMVPAGSKPSIPEPSYFEEVRVNSAFDSGTTTYFAWWFDVPIAKFGGPPNYSISIGAATSPYVQFDDQGNGGLYLGDRAIFWGNYQSSASLCCNTINLPTPENEFDFKIDDARFSEPSGDCNPPSGGYVRTITLRRYLISLDPVQNLLTALHLFGSNSVVTVTIDTQDCNFAPAQLYSLGVFSDNWVLDVGMPTTGNTTIMSRNRTGDGWSRGAYGGEAAGLIELSPGSVVPSAQGRTIYYSIISDTCAPI